MTDACYSMHIMLMYILYNVFLLMLTIPISKWGAPQMIRGMQNKLKLSMCCVAATGPCRNSFKKFDTAHVLY
jgi:hypothetical protein